MASRSPSPEWVDQAQILGTLFLVGKQGHRKNADLQSFPIDTDTITIGRDVDCDLRLYFPDVSKIHCEIRFDLLTNTANLLILGSNRVLITPAHNPSTSVSMSKGQAHQLSTNDTFTIRKKTFRFEYAPEGRGAMQAVIENTPVKRRQSTIEPRRGSYRLSLVPEGKRFVPLPSNLGLPETPKKTAPVPESHEEEVEEEEGEECVTVVEGDNNDRIYLEPVSLSPKPFRTPQQQRHKMNVRHTDAVPRTRKVEMMQTPVKGPNSLRKALLMKSARKVLAADVAVEKAAPRVQLELDDEEQEEEEEADLSLDEIPAGANDVFADQHESFHDEDADAGDHDEDLEWQDEEVDPASIPLPETPLPARYTPQPIRQPRKSLAEIAGPPVRFERLPSTPGAHPLVERVPATPGTMGKASRRLIPVTPEPVQQSEWSDEDEEMYVDVDAERQRRRESLATPRALPLPPSSGFRAPIRDVPQSPSLFFASPVRHPALTRQAAQLSDSPPATPMDALKQRMAALRLQSSARRATVGLELPSTPVTKPRVESALYTAGRMRRAGPSTPRAPLLPIESLPSTPTPETVSLQDVSPQKVDLQLESDEQSDEEMEEAEEEDEDRSQQGEDHEASFADEYGFEQEEEEPDNEQLSAQYLENMSDDTPASPSTPSYSGLRDLLREPVQPPPTPYFAGLRNLFTSTPERPSTPQMSGIREMMRTPAPGPSTPAFAGLRSMFALRTAPPTPAMDLDEVFDVPVEELGVQGVGLDAELEALVEPEMPPAEEVATVEEDEGEETEGEIEAAPVPVRQATPEAPAPARATRAKRGIPALHQETKSEPVKGKPRAVAPRMPRSAAARTRAAAPLAEVETQSRIPAPRATRSIAKPTLKAAPAKAVEEKIAPAPSRIPKRLPTRAAAAAAKPTSEEPVRTTRARARA